VRRPAKATRTATAGYRATLNASTTNHAADTATVAAADTRPGPDG